MPDQLNPDQQQILADRLRRAKSGELQFAWLHKLVLDAGYAPVLGADPNDKILVTARALAAGYGISVRSIRVWIQNGMPTHRHAVGNRPALFDVWDVQHWHRERAIAAGKPEMAQKGHRVSASKEMYHAEQARKAKRLNDLAEGILIPAADVASQLRIVGLSLRRKFEIIGRKHGSEVATALIRAIDGAHAKWQKIVMPELEKKRRKVRKQKRKSRKRRKPGKGK